MDTDKSERNDLSDDGKDICISELSSKLEELKSTLTRSDTTAEVLSLACYKLVETLDKAQGFKPFGDVLSGSCDQASIDEIKKLQQILQDIAEQLTAQLFVIDRQMPSFRHIVLSQLTYWSTMLLKCIGNELGENEEPDYGRTCIALATLLTTIISHITAFAAANYDEEDDDSMPCTAANAEMPWKGLPKPVNVEKETATSKEVDNDESAANEDGDTGDKLCEGTGDDWAFASGSGSGIQKFTVYQTKYDEGRNLLMHAKTHNVNVFECTICKQTFDAKNQLLSHAKDIHKKKSLFECQDCTKAFTTRQSLKIHTRTHTGEKPYICEYCTKAFSVLSNLRQHIRLHTDERPYKCSHCDLSFRVKRNLNKHEQRHRDD